MKARAYLAAITVITAGIGCSNIPTQPTQATPYKPQHDNVRAVFKGYETGPVYYLCATQPRTYTMVVDNGPDRPATVTRTTEEDHYLQFTPCPTTPID